MSQGIIARQSLWRRQVNFRLNLLYNKNAFVGYKLKVRHRQIVRRLCDVFQPTVAVGPIPSPKAMDPGISLFFPLQ